MQSTDPAYVAAALDPLFALPLDFQPEVDEALELVEPDAAREYLIDRLSKDYQRGDCAVFQRIFGKLGTGEAEPRLLELFRNDQTHVGARACILDLICGRDRRRRNELLGELGENDRHAVIDEPLRELIADAIEDASAAIAIAYIAEHFPESRMLPLERHIELIRKRMGATAATVYEPLLCSMKLASLHDAMIEALVEEAAPDARHALECAAESAEDETRQKFEAALDRLAETTPGNGVAAAGRLGPIDGPGRFEVAIVIENPEGTRTLAFLLIDNDEILDGFVDFDPPEDLLGSDHLPRVEITDAEIAAVVAPALKKTLRDALDPYTRAAVRYFERLPAAKPMATPDAALEIDVDALVEELIEREEYFLWAFAPEDFHQCEIPEPPEDPDDEWISMAMRCLDRTEIRAQVRRDAEFMARWHLAAGEAREAAAMARIAAEIESGFKTHPLVRAMVERSVEILHHPDIPEGIDDDDLGDGFDLDATHDPEEIRDALLLDIIDKQIRGADPKAAPEVYGELTQGGLSDEEARRKMAAVLDADLREVIEKERPHDPRRYEAALRDLLN